MSTPGVSRVELCAQSVKLSRGILTGVNVESLVLRAWPSGCFVSAGSVEFPAAALILLTGHGVTFEGTKFTGAGIRRPLHKFDFSHEVLHLRCVQLFVYVYPLCGTSSDVYPRNCSRIDFIWTRLPTECAAQAKGTEFDMHVFGV